MSNNYYFFCLAYANIPAILSIIERKGISKSNINIIVTLKSRRLFWQELIKYNNLKWKIIFLKKIENYNLKNPINWYKIRKDIKIIFENNFKCVNYSNIYFFSHSFALDAFALIKMLSQAKNKIYFLDCDKMEYPKWHKLYKLKSVIRLLILGYICFGVDILIADCGWPFPTLSVRFFKNINVQRLSEKKYPYDINILRKYNFISKDITENKTIVLIDEDCFSQSSLSKEEFSNFLSRLKNIIDSNFKRSEVLFKRHPSIAFHTKQFNSIYCDYSECPFYISADFIFTEPSIRWVVGGYSTVLRDIPKYYNNVKSISYLKLLTFRNENMKKIIIKGHIEKSDNKINLPNSWEELNLLLKRNNIRGKDS